MNLDLAHGIYNFRNRPPADAQDTNTINNICDSLQTFSNGMERGIRDVFKLLSNSNPKVDVNWCGEYGCSWLAVEDVGSSPETKFNIFVIAPDAWHYSIHSSRDSGRCFHSSSDCFSILTKHSVLAKDYEAFKMNFRSFLSKSVTQTQNLRSAATNERGHQKTPAFIFALLCDAHPAGGGGRVAQGVSQARGAFTDVGLHTGGTRRNTCWAIVESTIKFLLMCESVMVCYEKIKADFDLWVVDCFLAKISAEEDGPATDYINAVMEILAAVAVNISTLAENDLDVTPQEDKCLQCRLRLDELVREKMERKAAEYVLPNLSPSSLLVNDISLTMPRKVLVIPPPTATMSVADINRQLRCYQMCPPPEQYAIHFLTTWTKSITSQDSTFSGLCAVVNSVEESLYYWAADLTNEGEGEELSCENISELPLLWSQYSQTMGQLQSHATAKHLSGVELKSRELLSAWIIYCLLHRAVRIHFPLVREYDVCLRGCDLRHLVLSDRRAIDAATAVHRYLSRHSTTRQELFSMRMPEISYKFAEQYAKSSPRMKTIYQRELDAASKRKAARWRKIQSQKIQAAELRIKIADIQAQMNKITFHYDRYGSKIFDTEYYKWEDLNTDLSSKQATLGVAETPPPPIFQPLPSNETFAMRAIGFLYLPLELRHLFESGFIAQRLLAPKPIEKTSPSMRSDTVFRTYFATYSTSLERNTQTTVGLCSSYQKPSHVGSTHIDMCRTDEDGIWYPDQMLQKNSLTMLWNGFKFNPFSTDSMVGAIVEHFTDKFIASNMISMQYTLLQSGEQTLSMNRGNLPIAQQGQNPIQFSKPEFLEFSTIRSYPCQQIRRICSALRDSSLPLSDPNCRTLLRQALYHLGEFSSASVLVWKQDLVEGSWLQVLEKELAISIEAVGQTIRESNSLSILGEVASYISQWLPREETICSARLAAQNGKRCGDGISKEIEDLKASIINADNRDVTTSAEQLTKLCFKQAIYYMTALCCFAYLPLSSDDVTTMIQLRVLAAKSHALASRHDFDNETTTLVSRKGELSAQLDHIMTVRMRDIVTGMRNDFRCLTKALQEEVHCLPDDLKWKVLSSSQYCFETKHGVDNYHINIISGSILINGSPPSILPASILDHPVYRRSFGNSNFEVSSLPNQSYRTIRHLRGRIYELSPPTNTSPIIIREIDSRTGLMLELMDGTQSQQWQGDMPIRLREHYSHWLDREKNILLIRPIEFWDRKIVFFAQKEAFSNKWEFRQVAPHQQRYDLDGRNLVGNKSGYRRLVLLSNTAVRKIFNRFEEDKYIEYYEDVNITIFLPRFQLSFEIADGVCKSKEFAEFTLAVGQQLSDCFYNFSSYLMLSRESEQKLILPVGDLHRGSNEVRVVCPSSTSYSQRSYYSFDEHQRFKHFQAADITSRLYLALVFCATSTLLPDIRHTSTGAEVALDAVRKCWQNTPMTDEQEKLVRLIQKQAWQFPALTLVCEDLIDSSMQTGFLVSKEINQTNEHWQSASDAGIEYMNLSHPLNIRSSLTSIEATRFLGVDNKPKMNMRVLPKVGPVEISECPIPSRLIRDCELQLESLITDHNAPDVSKLLFPIDSSKLIQSRIRNEVLADLEESWKAYIGTPSISLTYNDENSLIILNQTLISVSAALQGIEDFLLAAINTIPKNCSALQTIRYRLMKASNQLPTVNKRELMQIALDFPLLHVLNPFLSQKAEIELKAAIVYWLKLCVLQDKIGRLILYASSKNNAQMISELQVVRLWDVNNHMEWLVFEVEGQLQIRPLQYIIARKLIDHPGSIGQLNMGEGKTRVILPMLVLHLAKGKEVIRLHFLRQLLDEAFSYLHRYLCASVLHRKIFLLPFNRDVIVKDTIVLDAVIKYCAQSRGCFCIAPEQRLSLLLKSDELACAGPEEKVVAEKLRAIECSHRFYDIMDEADEILRHKYELVYAVGSSVSLPSGAARWNAVQNILRIIDNPTNERLKTILSNEKITVRGTTGVASFRTIRLLPGNNMNTVSAELLLLLMQELLDKPPYDLIWVERVRHLRGLIVAFATDASTMDEEKIVQALGMGSPEMESLLALRGLLSHGILIHCLQKSHRIHFGIKRPGKKRLAVPFFAADTPSERSEFQHPDVSITYTTLAYYEDGLSREELLDAFKHLLSIGPVAQDSIYKTWLERSASAIAPSDRKSIENVSKVDLSNTVQRDLLVKYFCKNMETINYWLAFVVFPKDTRQYPERMSVNGWHLCSNADVAPVGFSGTNDNKMLLPLQVKQIDIPERKDLLGTNGKMMTLIIKNTRYVDVDTSNQSNKAVGKYFSVSYWTQDQVAPAPTTTVLDKIVTHLVRENANALIDAGGLIVGRNNRDVAKELAKHFSAVVYFDTDKSNWYVVDKIGRQWVLSNSPIRERDAFVYFDDRRCRGSDMKLKPNAHAMLTIGPKMCKDKLMQAAGRMRQLDKGQTIFLAGCSDVSYLIQSQMELRSPSEITSTHVLHWVLNNTILSLAPEGLMMWAVQGTHYCSTHQQKPGTICMKEKLSLYELYHGTLQRSHLPIVATSTISSYRHRLPQTRGITASLLRKTSQDITSRITVRGEGYYIMQTGLDEECERELQVEIDVEKEAEKQIPKMQPADESDWDFDGLLRSAYRTAALVPTSLSLKKAVQETMQTIFRHIDWAEKAFCTRNYLNTVCNAQGGLVNLKQDYLRLVHFILIFSVDGSMLLVSEREADCILRRMQQVTSARYLPFEMVDLAYCRLAVTDPGAYRSLGPSMPTALPTLLQRTSMKELVSVQLFGGETVFSTTAQKNALKEMLSTGNRALARQAAMLLPEIRGLHFCIPRSDLERIEITLPCTETRSLHSSRSITALVSAGKRSKRQQDRAE
eukprot:gene22332-30577_t